MYINLFYIHTVSKINIINKTINVARKTNRLHLSSQSKKANAALLNQKYIKRQGFPGGPVVKNLPCSAGDNSSILGLGRLHMLPGN